MSTATNLSDRDRSGVGTLAQAQKFGVAALDSDRPGVLKGGCRAMRAFEAHRLWRRAVGGLNDPDVPPTPISAPIIRKFQVFLVGAPSPKACFHFQVEGSAKSLKA